MDDQERKERDPAAIQRELMEIDKLMDVLQPQLEDQLQILTDSKLQVDSIKSRMTHLKSRAMILQSVLRSIR